MKEIYKILGSLTMLLICGIVIGITIMNIYPIDFNNILNKNKVVLSETSNCSNLSLIDTSHCLNSEVKTFYKYNISQLGKKLNLSELKEYGGVCQHYADYIRDRFIQLGAKERKCGDNKIESNNSKFYVQRCDMSVTNETAHVITIASNKEGWCYFSDNNINCEEFSQ